MYFLLLVFTIVSVCLLQAHAQTYKLVYRRCDGLDIPSREIPLNVCNSFNLIYTCADAGGFIEIRVSDCDGSRPTSYNPGECYEGESWTCELLTPPPPPTDMPAGLPPCKKSDNTKIKYKRACDPRLTPKQRQDRIRKRVQEV